jgi:hypothetical protein
VVDPQDPPEDLFKAFEEMRSRRRSVDAVNEAVLEMLYCYGTRAVLEALADQLGFWGDQALEPLDEDEAQNPDAAANWALASDRIRDALRFASAAIEHEERARREDTSG